MPLGSLFERHNDDCIVRAQVALTSQPSYLRSTMTVMSSIDIDIPVLRFLPSLPMDKGSKYPQERDINRDVLTDIAPDRYEILLGAPDIETIRQTLKSKPHGHDSNWLNGWHLRSNQKLTASTVAVTITGTLDRPFPPPSPGLRRTRLMTSIRMSRRMAVYGPDFQESPRVAEFHLSTRDKLISPRPLGPTHSLVAYDTSPLSGYFSRLVESPINDLLFVANCPNLRTVEGQRTLPPRVKDQLPRVLVKVKSLEAWPELVIYLHTKNQAALFRALVPEWIRDLVHPLPLGEVVGPVQPAPGRKLSLDCLPRRESIPVPTRTVETIAEEIVDAEAFLTCGTVRQDVLDVSKRLDALRDNLDFIGYFNAELWLELDITMLIIVKVMNLKAKVADEE